jgi:hypothetical protein
MSLDVTLSTEVYSRNITHNLNEMAKAANIYEYLWRPDEIGISRAHELISPMRRGLALLESDANYFRTFNPPNGWGSYEGLIEFVREYLAACERHPYASVHACR